MQILRGRRSAIYHLAVSPDSRYVAAGGLTELHVWDLLDPDAKPTRHAESSDTLQFRNDGRLFTDTDGGWRIHDPVAGRTVRWERADAPPVWARSVWGAASPCGQFVLQRESRDGFRCWRLGEDSLGLHRELVWSLPEATTSWQRPLFTPDSEHFAFLGDATGQGRESWAIHRTADGQRVAHLETRNVSYLWKRFTPDGGKFLSGVQSGIFEWDARAGGPSRLAVRHPTGRHFRDVAVHPGGATLAGITGDDGVSLFDLAGGGLLRTFDWQVGHLQHVAFTPDGTRCAVAGSSGKLLLFDVE